MIVAALTDLSIDDDTSAVRIQTALYVGAVTGLMFTLGEERYVQITQHYRRMHQDNEYEICNARLVEEPEFDLSALADCKDPIHLFVSERLVIDDFIKREAAGAPDVLVAAGDFLNEVDDWERHIFRTCPITDTPDRIEITTRVIQQAMSDGLLSITFNEAKDGYPPILIVVAEGTSGWLQSTYNTKFVAF